MPVKPLTAEDAARGRAQVRKYTAAEVAQHVEAVEQLLLQSASHGQVHRALKETFGVGRHRSENLIKRVFAKWEAERSEDRAHDRDLLIKSIKRSIAQCESKLAEVVGTQAWATLNNVKLRYQEQLMDLTGARAPEEVNVNVNAHVSNTVLAVVTTLSADQVQRLRERRRARELQGEVVQAPALPPYTSGSAE